MYLYQAQIIDESADEIVATVSSYSEEGLLEEMGKSKWTGAIKNYEEEIEDEICRGIEQEEKEDLGDEKLVLEEKLSEEELEGDYPRQP